MGVVSFTKGILDVGDLVVCVDIDIEDTEASEVPHKPPLEKLVGSKEGRAMLTIFAAFAELERESIRERQLEGIAIAKESGKYEKTTKLTPELISYAKRRITEGLPKAVVTRELGREPPDALYIPQPLRSLLGLGVMVNTLLYAISGIAFTVLYRVISIFIHIDFG